MLTTCHVSCVTFQVPYVSFHVSRVTCQLSHITCHKKIMELVNGGSVITGHYPITKCSPPVICHVSHFTCHMLVVMCHMSITSWRVCYEWGTTPFSLERNTDTNTGYHEKLPHKWTENCKFSRCSHLLIQDFFVLSWTLCMAGELWFLGIVWHQKIIFTQYWPGAISFPHLAQLDNLDFTLSPR